MTVDRYPRLVDVRQIGPNSERDISGRCSGCGVVLIARLENGEDTSSRQLRERLEEAFARHLSETRCGEESARSAPKQGPAAEDTRD
jgi:hypothetical protein